jgi:hypothetical protein
VGGSLSERSVGRGLQLSDEVDEGEAALTDLTEDAEAALVNPDVTAARRRIVEGVEARHRAAHPHALSYYSSLPGSWPPANSDTVRLLNLGFVWFY